MTFIKLKQIVKKHNIPDDVTLMSDSGWECDATDMDCVLYNQKENIIVFKQCVLKGEYNNNKDWKLLYGLDIDGEEVKAI